MMKFSDIFYTIQGEGKLIGIPSVFFRTSYCNLRCVWCDTPYTSWQPENKEIAIADAVEEIKKYFCQHVVITGGEPFLQSDELVVLCHELKKLGHHITIETNATIFAEVEANLISMSPKLKNSTPKPNDKFHQKHERERINYPVICRLMDLYDFQLKFVIDTPADLDEIQSIQREIDVAPEMIMLMPQGVEREEVRSKQEWIAELCKEHGYRYSPRLHIDIWGNTRGV